MQQEPWQQERSSAHATSRTNTDPFDICMARLTHAMGLSVRVLVRLIENIFFSTEHQKTDNQSNGFNCARNTSMECP